MYTSPEDSPYQMKEQEADLKDKACKLCSILQKEGFQSYLVGGAMRDTLLFITPKDYDIATDASPENIISIFESLGYKTLRVGEAFGIIVVLYDNIPFEIATFRTEEGTDGRHPEKVTFVSDIVEDLARRDFTMNAIAVDPIKNSFIDPFMGVKDVRSKIIKFVGDPISRIEEDQLRILRAFRFMSTLKFTIESNSLNDIDWAVSEKNCLKNVSQERISEEFRKILIGNNATITLNHLIKNKLLFIIIPELEHQLEPHNSPYHREDWQELGNSILAHTMNVFSHSVKLTPGETPDDKFIFRMAALLHDIGKPACRENRGDHDRFLGHDIKGAEIATEILTRMKYKREYIDPIVECVKYHMNCHDIPKMKNIGKIRQFLGKKYFNYIYNTAIFDTLGTLNNTSPQPDASNLIDCVEKTKEKYPEMLPERLISGDDLISAGFKPSAEFKKALDIGYTYQLNNCDNKQKCLNQAISYLKTKGEKNVVS
jgi:putative nucleotidyltransferase with HDIG domain